MDPLLITAASGMKARMDSLDMLANNMANSGTAGFKTIANSITYMSNRSRSSVNIRIIPKASYSR